MRIVFVLTFLALTSCGHNEPLASSSVSSNADLVQKKDCVTTMANLGKLVGVYPSPQTMYLAVADWALALAHDQDCTINDDDKFFAVLDENLSVKCSKENCEIKTKSGGN
jgi:hypothetical protein